MGGLGRRAQTRPGSEPFSIERMKVDRDVVNLDPDSRLTELRKDLVARTLRAFSSELDDIEMVGVVDVGCDSKGRQ